MLGNVWEWGWDWLDSSTDYGSGSVTDPTGQSAGLSRVLRGGYEDTYARHARSALRNYAAPGARRRDIGFRPVRSLP